MAKVEIKGEGAGAQIFIDGVEILDVLRFEFTGNADHKDDPPLVLTLHIFVRDTAIDVHQAAVVTKNA